MTQDENEPMSAEEREDARGDEAYHRRKDDELTGDAPPSIITRSLLNPNTVNLEAETDTLLSWWGQGRRDEVARAIGKYPGFIAGMITAAFCMRLIENGHGTTSCAFLAVVLESVGRREGAIRA